MIHLQLEEGEMDIVFNALLDQPARRVMAVIGKIQGQVTHQMAQHGLVPVQQASQTAANPNKVVDLPPKRPVQ